MLGIAEHCGWKIENSTASVPRFYISRISTVAGIHRGRARSTPSSREIASTATPLLAITRIPVSPLSAPESTSAASKKAAILAHGGVSITLALTGTRVAGSRRGGI